jgi:hypothetical protein
LVIARIGTICSQRSHCSGQLGCFRFSYVNIAFKCGPRMAELLRQQSGGMSNHGKCFEKGFSGDEKEPSVTIRMLV